MNCFCATRHWRRTCSKNSTMPCEQNRLVYGDRPISVALRPHLLERSQFEAHKVVAELIARRMESTIPHPWVGMLCASRPAPLYSETLEKFPTQKLTSLFVLDVACAFQVTHRRETHRNSQFLKSAPSRAYDQMIMNVFVKARRVNPTKLFATVHITLSLLLWRAKGAIMRFT
jgi:hypothetical protein